MKTNGQLAKVCYNLLLVTRDAVVETEVGGYLHHVCAKQFAEL